MTTLDNIKQIKKIDKSNMAGYILEMPQQIEESLKKIKELDILTAFRQGHPKGRLKGGLKFQNVCLCGMGGSAIANHLVANLPFLERKIPMYVVRNYAVPDWVDKNTLIIITSHSGRTRETLSAFKNIINKEPVRRSDKGPIGSEGGQMKIFIIAERGQLEDIGEDVGAIVFDYDTKAEPRASLGYQLGAVFGLLNKLKIIKQNIYPSIELLKKLNTDFNTDIKTEENLAKKLAFCCLDRLPIIVSSGILQSVAWRWKTQINENANQLAFTEFLPEAMHNAIQGLGLPKRFQDDLIYIILKNSFDSQELILQFKKFENILENKKIRYEIIEPLGNDVWSQKLSSLILGDWASYYLALLNGVDPTPVETIKKTRK